MALLLLLLTLLALLVLPLERRCVELTLLSRRAKTKCAAQISVLF